MLWNNACIYSPISNNWVVRGGGNSKNLINGGDGMIMCVNWLVTLSC